ncbi:MAG: hypothetical protein HFJ08_16635 [Lachnospiraceae bacterium]|jgi:hypothetical protein|nr:hypothetical protein [Lachnospiraceae bacterium]
MKVTFQRVDDEYFGVEKYVRPVVEIAIKNNIFVQILCEILNTFDTYSEHILYDINKLLKLYETYKIGRLDETARKDYSVFTQKVYDFYWTILDDNFGEEIRWHNEELYRKKGLRYADKRLHRYRGILFEELIGAMVQERFKNDTFCTGCRIYVNGKRIISQYGKGNSFHKETIDIAGWINNLKYGEFYECKVNPKRFEIQNYQYFMKIQNTLDENNVHYILALVSADAAEFLRVQKEYIEEQLKCTVEFETIGREDICSIVHYTVPEIV